MDEWNFADAAYTQDSHLRRVDQRCKVIDSQLAEIGDREGSPA